MDIDLLEDRLTAQFIYNEGFTLYELYDIKGKLIYLDSIINSIINTSSKIGFSENLVQRHKQLDTIADNMIAVDKVIYYFEGKIIQKLGVYGDLSLN